MTTTAYLELRDFLSNRNTKSFIQHLQTGSVSGLDNRELEDVEKKLKNYGIVEEPSLGTLSHEFRQILGARRQFNFASLSSDEIEEIAANWITK
jgi:hypothetical protein